MNPHTQSAEDGVVLVFWAAGGEIRRSMLQGEGVNCRRVSIDPQRIGGLGDARMRGNGCERLYEATDRLGRALEASCFQRDDREDHDLADGR